jgi:CRISPR/Cas system-associated protein endoribonuclease Cas2
VPCEKRSKETRIMEKRYSAVYQYGYVIFGIGNTEEEAIEDAKLYAEEFEIQENRPNDGDMILIEISEALFNKVKEFGGDVKIEKDEDGVYKLPEEIEE